MGIDGVKVDYSNKLEENLLEGRYDFTRVVRNEFFENNDSLVGLEFVENKSNFLPALQPSEYNKYFIDRVA